jgi:hypothetical protein
MVGFLKNFFSVTWEKSTYCGLGQYCSFLGSIFAVGLVKAGAVNAAKLACAIVALSA